jgi:hypothetical protein
MEMRKFKLILLLAVLSIAAAPNRQYSYVAHTTIDPTQNNANENGLYSYLQAGVDTYAAGSIDNTAISASAGIAYSKLNLIGAITNNDISASAGIVGSKLDLTTAGPIGSVSANTGAFTTLTSSSTANFTGNVGIGYSSNQTPLAVNGNVGVGTHTASNGRLIVSGGNVGIGTINPGALLDVSGISRQSGDLILNGTSANIRLGSNYLSGDGGDEGVTVNSSGNVGIGSASPGAIMDIAGNTRITNSGKLISKGTVPTLDSCPTGSALVTGSTDIAGTIDVGNNTGSNCNLVFSSAWPVAPNCVLFNQSNPLAVLTSTVSTTQLDITGSAAITDDNIVYICIGN